MAIDNSDNKPATGKEVLLALEEERVYVFHGTYHKLDSFEPRQAYSYDSKTGRNIPDGRPAVFASVRSEPAIFHALINKAIDPTPGHWSGWSSNKGNFTYRSVQSALDRLKDPQIKGYVHVFRRLEFESYRGHEFVSYKEVQPVLVIEVTAQDLPENIEIVEPIKP